MIGENCRSCPRECGAIKGQGGVCGAYGISVSKSLLHFWEEPPISGNRGSGAIFFSGCPLKCGYCQNIAIRDGGGDKLSPSQFEDILLDFNDRAENINLVTAGHLLEYILPSLKKIKPLLRVPVIYNSSGYESASAIESLDGIVDVYLPDFKYSKNFEGEFKADGYEKTAIEAIAVMLEQQPKVKMENGLIKKGVIIRHLVLPGFKENSFEVLKLIADNFKGSLISLMRQYTPEFNRSGIKSLDRRVTSFEYDKVLERAENLSLEGFMQEKGCADTQFVPNFIKE